ncbi:hypothetical protein PBF_24106 [Cytobacillus firmus DS1]|uniref:Uncharacterized protein n=1 Tax=Cytobacillus firmus DS1 TaxID=1307436 RepID=W7KYQ9_CYTFI|nr:hypothetical protein PBF_24106 [Cytobacillus firmus DS1]
MSKGNWPIPSRRVKCSLCSTRWGRGGFPLSATIKVDSIGFEPRLLKKRDGHITPGDWLANLSAEIIENHGVEVALGFWRRRFLGFSTGRHNSHWAGAKAN